MRNITETVKHLLIINIIFFIASLSLGDLVYDLFALHYPSNPKFQYWQPLTHMFMHGDLSHIFFNMFGLYMFGTPIEQMWGKKKFMGREYDGVHRETFVIDEAGRIERVITKVDTKEATKQILAGA